MTKVSVSIGQYSSSEKLLTALFPDLRGSIAEVLSPGSASVVTQSAAPARSVAIVAATEGDAWVTAGPAPVAVVPCVGQIGEGFPLRSGETRTFGLNKGDRVAAINLSGFVAAPVAGLINLTVATNTALDLALATLGTITGGTIKLAASGSPYRISRDNVAALGEVVITSDDPLAPATIDLIAKTAGGGAPLTGWRNVAIVGVKLDRRALAYGAVGQHVPNVWLDQPENVEVRTCLMQGRAVARWPGAANPDNVVLGDMGIRLISPKNCKLLNNVADGYCFWLQSTGDAHSQLQISGNKLSHGQKDYIQILGGGSGIVISDNDLSDTLGSINEYQTDTGNHDDLIQVETSSSGPGFDDFSVLRNMLDGGGRDSPQSIYLKDGGLKGIRGLAIQHNACRGSQGNGIGINANSGPGVTGDVSNNLVLWSAVPHDPADPQIANAKPAINLANGFSGTCNNNITAAVTTTGSTVTQTGNVLLNYATPSNANYAENLFPGSLAIGVDKYRIREARLPAGNVAGPSIIKRDLAALSNRLAGLAAGQSNEQYFYDNSRMEFQAALNDIAPAATSFVFGDGATPGSALLEINKPSANPTYYWYNDATNAPGPCYDTWAAEVDRLVANGRPPAWTIWNQGEGDAYFIGASDANATRYFAGLQAVFALMRGKMSGLRIYISAMNRRGDDPATLAAPYIAGFERLRDWHASYAAANPSFVTLLPEMYDLASDGGAHSVDAGYDTLAPRFARKIARTLGYPVAGGVDGPRLIGAVRTGTSVVFEFAQDGGTELTPAGDGQGLRYTANGAEIVLSAVTVVDATHVSATLASTPAAGATEVAEFGYGCMLITDYTKVIRDNQAVPLPVRHGKLTPSVNAGADITAPTITSPATGSAANNTAYSRTLTANEAVTFAKRTGDQTAAFGLSGSTLTLPAQTAAGPYIANLRATDMAGNVTDFVHTVTVAAAAVAQPWTNALFNRKASVSSGQNIPNQIAAPADGSAQSAYDAFLGSSTGASTDDPTFTAAAGGVPAYFRNDGTDNVQTVATDFLKRLSLDKAWSYALLLKAPSVWTAGTVPVLFGVGAATATAAGIQVRYVVNNNQIRVATADGSTGPSINLTATLPTTGYVMVVMTYDASTKTLTFYVNSVTSLAIPATTTLNGAAGTANFISGSALSDGAGWIEDIMASGIKASSDVAALRDYWQTQYGISIF